MSLFKDKYISFVINNYRDIEALMEIYDHAKASIPSLLDREMRRLVDEIEFNNVEVHYNEGFLWWCDPEIYDLDSEKGPYFAYESRWGSLFSGNDPEDASYLYLHVDVEDIKQKSPKKEYIDTMVQKLKKEANKLKSQGCKIISPVNYDDPYLLTYSLHKEINMDTLSSKERLEEIVKKTIKSFTETCLSILKKSK